MPKKSSVLKLVPDLRFCLAARLICTVIGLGCWQSQAQSVTPLHPNCNFYFDTLNSFSFSSHPNGQTYEKLLSPRKFRLQLFPERAQLPEVRANASSRNDAELFYVTTSPERPWVYLQSGLGGTGFSSYNFYFAWHLQQAGFNVVSIPNLFFWRMALATSSHLRPGHRDVDSRDLQNTYTFVDEFLKSNGLTRSSERIFLGLSHGALQGLWLSSEPWANQFFSKFALLNPPLDLGYGIDFLDRGLKWGLSNLTLERQNLIFGQLMAIANQLSETSGDPSGRQLPELNISAEEIQFAISSYFLNSVQEVAIVSQWYRDQNVFRNQDHASRLREARRWTGYRYFDEILRPFFEGAGSTRIPHVTETSLRQDLAKASRHPKLWVAHSRNDWITRSQDLSYLERVFPKNKVDIFECGGHLGNLDRILPRLLRHLN